MYGQSKLKGLVANIVMQCIKGIEAMCKTQWYILGMLAILTLDMLYFVINKIRKSSFFKGCLFSNNTQILFLFPIPICTCL